MKYDFGPVARGRALTRLVQEKRDRYRRIYVTAPDDLSTSKRQDWAQKRLVDEYSERYRSIYDEERAKLKSADNVQEVDTTVVGKSSGPGPYHAVYLGRAATACGRIRFHTYPAGLGREVTCTYCVDNLREKRRHREVDPEFHSHVAAASAAIGELIELQRRTKEALVDVLGALSKLRTPPGGTAERSQFAEVLAGALDCGLTLREIGAQMNLSAERVRQIVAERAAS